MVTTDANHTRSVDRACEILFALSDMRGDAGVTAVARRVGLGKSTVFRLLHTLMTRGLVAYNAETQSYRLGGRLLQLGLRLQEQLPIRHEATPFLHALRDVTRESATLYLAMNGECVAITQVITLLDPKRFPQLGRTLPLHRGC